MTFFMMLGLSRAMGAAQHAALEVRVRECLIQMEQKPNPGAIGTGMIPFDKGSAPILMKLMPAIEAPWVFEVVAVQLRAWEIRASIPLLVHSLDRDLVDPTYPHHAAAPVLNSWGWVAESELLRRAVTGSFRGRLLSAQILVDQCRERPKEDPRLTRLFLRLSYSESAEFRKTAISGLNNLSGQIFGWMEMTHAATMDNPVAFERIMEMTRDKDGAVAGLAQQAIRVWLWSHDQGRIDAGGYGDRPHTSQTTEVEALREFIQRSPSASMRASALVLLSFDRVPEPDQLQPLSDSDPMVRHIAVAMLKDRFRGDLLPTVARIAQFGAPGAREAAASLLGWSRLALALPILKPLVSDPSAVVRQAAKLAIDRIEGGALRVQTAVEGGK